MGIGGYLGFRRIRKSGLILIAILVLTLIVTFFIGALLQMNPTRLRRTAHDENHDRAVAAARFGVEYSLSQLTEGLDWKGGADKITVEDENVVVREQGGAVEGWIRSTSDEPWSAFRLHFANDLAVVVKEDSLNNLDDAYTWQQTNQTNSDPLVPEKSVRLVVEGFAGGEIAPEVSVSDSSGLAKRTIEGIYRLGGFDNELIDGTAMQAGGNSTFKLAERGEVTNGLEQGVLRVSAPGRMAKMRTKASSTLNGGQLIAGDYNFYPDRVFGVFIGDQGESGFQPTLPPGYPSFSAKTEAPEDGMLDIEWDYVKTSKQDDPIKIPGGVYAFLEDDSGNKSMVYYDTSVENYLKYLNGDKDISLVAQKVPDKFLENLNPGVAADGKVVLRLKRDLNVVQSSGSGTSDLAIIPIKGAKYELGSGGSGGGHETGGIAASSPNPGTDGYSIPPLPDPGPVGGGGASGPTGGGGDEGDEGDEGQPPEGGFPSPIPGETTLPMETYNEDGYGSSRLVATRAVLLLGVGLAAGQVGGSSGATTALNDIVPQDIELRFEPEGVKSAAIRTKGTVFLGTRLKGRGGSVVAGKDLYVVGLGVDFSASPEVGEGISFYSKENINISTCDEREQKYHDVAIEGVVFAKKNIDFLLGDRENGGKSGANWGDLKLAGTTVALGGAPRIVVNPTSSNPHGDGVSFVELQEGGNVDVVARGVSMFFDPRFLTPYLDPQKVRVVFDTVSVAQY